jgi:hypothetical protein
MNRHIERLLESAPYTTISTEGRLFSQRDMAVFAEALVRECADLINSMDHSSQYFPHVADAIKEHFGVEE